MSDRTEVFTFRAIDEDINHLEMDTVDGSPIEALYKSVRPKGTGTCLIVIEREPGARRYVVNTLTDEQTETFVRCLPLPLWNKP